MHISDNFYQSLIIVSTLFIMAGICIGLIYLDREFEVEECVDFTQIDKEMQSLKCKQYGKHNFI